MSEETTCGPRLLRLWGDRKNSESYLLNSPSVLIGRSCDNDIIFEESSVSSSHCKIYEKGGHHYILDLESTNGTKVNGLKIQEETKIVSGDIIVLGEVEVLFESEAEKDFRGKTVIDMSYKEIQTFSTENLSPFNKGRRNDTKINRIFYVVLGILGLTSVVFLFFLAKSLLAI